MVPGKGEKGMGKLHHYSQKIAAYLLVFTMVCSILGIISPNVVRAKSSGSEAADSLTLKVGYSKGDFKTAKVFTDKDFSKGSKQAYSFMDSLPTPGITAAKGIPLEDLLADSGIKLKDVDSFIFYTTDMGSKPYKTISKSSLYERRYYYPELNNYWDSSTASFTDVTSAVYHAEQVEPMICISDNWVRGATKPDFSEQDDSNKYRLLIGQPDNPKTITAPYAIKWICEIDVVLAGSPPAIDPNIKIPENMAVSDVTLNKSSVTLSINDTTKLVATVKPNNAINKEVTWSSNDSKVATVDSDGRVKAISEGTAKITVTTKDGAKTDQCTVKVVKDLITVTNVSLNKTSISLTVGGAEQLKATVTPENATDKSVTWDSSNNTVATVSKNGLVTGLNEGAATITARTNTGNRTSTCSVKVINNTVVLEQVSSLKDISGHWAEKYIQELAALGIISGNSDGNYQPNTNINRAEFTTMLVKTLIKKGQVTQQSGKTYSDTKAHWAKDYISTAVFYGIVSGYDDERFAPDDLINREQMALMLARAFKLDVTVAQPTNFADKNKIASWAKEAINTTVSKGIMKGYPDNLFKPQDKAIKAEAATVICNALHVTGK
jgi:hypothetical protein